MRFARWMGCLAMLLSAAMILPLTGCGKDDKADDKQAKAKDAGTKDADHKDKHGGKKEITKEDAAHGWWCVEHGIIEEECSLCLPEAEVKKRFKDKGDWCKDHDRAKSQCFLCDPSLYEKVWEPKYVAKYGKKPPRPDDSEFEKK